MKLIKNLIINSVFLLIPFSIFAMPSEKAKDTDTVVYFNIGVDDLILSSETDSGKVVYAAPGEKISGQAQLEDLGTKLFFEFTQIIVGLDGIGAQDGIEYRNPVSFIPPREFPFTLVAPEKPGIYEVRFKEAGAYTVKDAIDCWWNVGHAPTEQSTIGLVVVCEDPKNAVRELNDKNWNEWMQQKYSQKESVEKDVEIVPTLTNDLMRSKDFWDMSKCKGIWKISDNTLSNGGTQVFNEHNKVVSRQAFENFDIQVTEVYERTKNKEKNWWSHSRGFGILYYISDERNVEFRYFADIKILSLYIRDNDKVISPGKRIYFEPGTEIVHDINIQDGVITWYVNGKLIFEETTTLRRGHLMLTNHNNSVTFTL